MVVNSGESRETVRRTDRITPAQLEPEAGGSPDHWVAAPRLSLVIGARNDSYMGDFLWRFQTSLNYLARNLEALGRLADCEVVVTDWGSQAPLHANLPLGEAAGRLVRFVHVPPAMATAAQGDSEFPIVIAQNVAVRRCRGEFIAQTDSDILFPCRFLEDLFDILDGRRPLPIPLHRGLFVSKRRQIPWRHIRRAPNPAELDWLVGPLHPLLPIDRMFPVPKLGRFAATGFVMMHRDLWEECGGYDQRLLHWGWMDIDLALRVTMKYPWMYLEDLGLPSLIHQEHYPPRLNRQPTRKQNPEHPPRELHPNGNDWGLHNISLNEYLVSKTDRAMGDVAARVRPRMLIILGQLILANIRWFWLRMRDVRTKA